MKKIAFPVFSVCLVLMAACSKNNQSVATAPPAAASVKGSALLIDENDAFLGNHSGTTISIENSQPQVSVQADVKGMFELPKPANAADTIVYKFEHTGYGTIRKYFTGGSFLDTSGLQVIMHPVSRLLVNHLSASITNGKLQMIFNVTVPAGSTNNYLAWVFRKNNPVISYDDAWGYRSVAVKEGDNMISICMCPEECGYFQKGDTMYLRGFGSVSPKFDGFAYGNYITNKLILSCANTAGNGATVALAIP